MSSAVAQWKIYRTRAELAGDQGTHDLAEEDWKEALKQARQLGQIDRRLAYTLEKLAESQFHLNKLNDATVNALESLSTYESLKENTATDLGRLNANLAKLYHARDMVEKAQEFYTTAIELKEKELGVGHQDVNALRESFESLTKNSSFAPPQAPEATPSMNLSNAPAETPVPSLAPAPAAPAPTQHIVEAETVPEKSPEPVLDLKSALDSIFAEEPNAIPPAIPIPTQAPTPVPAQEQAPASVPVSPPVESVAQAPPAMSPEQATQLWSNLRAMAENYLTNNNLIEAEKLWLEGLELLHPLGERNPNFCLTLESLGEIRLRMQDFPASENYFLRAYHIKVGALGPNHIAVAQTVNHLARLYYQGGNFEKAELFGRQCIELQEKLLGPEDGNLACSIHNLATLYHMQKKFDLAEPLYKRALEIKRKAFGPEHSETTRLLKSYSDLMRNMNRLNEADELDSMADGRISGTWRAIAVPTAPGSGKKMENCDICGTPLGGASRCAKCGYDTSLGVF